MASLRALVLLLPLLAYSGDRVSSQPSSTISGLSITPTDPVIFENQDIQFNCTYDAQEANVTWLRNGEELTGFVTESLPMMTTILLENVPSMWQRSEVTCMVDSGIAGGNISTSLTVYARSPTILTHPSNTTVDQGSPFSLTCVATGLPTPTISWCSEPSGLTTLPGVTMTDGRLEFSAASDSFVGEYFCKAENTKGVEESFPAFVRVRSSPTFARAPMDATVENGSSAVFQCKARGYPPPTISWTLNTRPLVTSGRVSISEGGDLTIRNVMLSDEGRYLCTAMNEVGMLVSDVAMLTVQVFPGFEVLPMDEEVPLGEDAILVCDVFAIPPPVYTWFHNPAPDGMGMEVQVEVDDRIIIVNGSLVIMSVQLEDRGEYVCQAENAAGAVCSPPVKLSVFAPPPPPQSLRVLSMGSSWIAVLWEASPNAEPPITTYHIEIRLSFHSNWTPANQTQAMHYNITGLYPSAPYHIRVRAESPSGIGEPSEEVNTTTEPGVPTHPENVTVETTGPTNLTVHWVVPDVVRMTSYNRTQVILLHPGGQMEQLESGESPVSFTELQPATPYGIMVTFFYTGGTGRSLAASGTTGDSAPGDSPNITNITNVTSHSLTITWIPPSQPNGDITVYTVRYSPVFGVGSGSGSGEEEVGGNETSVDLTGLLPFTNYSIMVSANTSAGEGPADEEFVMTGEDVPQIAPTGLTITPLSSTSLRFSWQPLADEDVPGILINYTVRYNQHHHGGSPQFESVGPEMTILEVDGLTPFTLYHVMVAGATSAGVGVFSERVEGRTLGAIPVAMVTITSLLPVGSFSLAVEWTQPDPREVYAPPEEVRYLVRWEEVEGGGEGEETTVLLNYTIDGLQPYTLYMVSVAVGNENGTGNPSDPVQNRTGESTPPAPTGLTVTPLSSTSLRFSWQPLADEDVPGILVNYTVRYNRQHHGGSPLFESVVPEMTTLEVDGLTPFTLYHVMVAGATSAGMGVFSERVEGRTLGAIPVATVEDVALSPSCPPSLLMRWRLSDPRLVYAEPEDVVYVVRWRGGGGEEEEEEEVPGLGVEGELNYTISNLTHNTTYTVSVAVRNGNGTGNFSSSVQDTTMEEGVPSGPPTNLTFLSITPHTVSLTWSPPSMPNGRLVYTVRYIESVMVGEARMVEVEDTNATIEGLQPFTEYTVVVMAMTSCGESPYSLPLEVRSGEARSGPPSSLSPQVVQPRAIRVAWGIPQETNGNISRYEVHCPNVAPVSIPSTVSDSYSYECTDLEPLTTYTISVAAVNGAGTGERANVTVTTACEGSSIMTAEAEGGVRLLVEDSINNCPTQPSYILVVVQELRTYTNGSFDPPARLLSSYTVEELVTLTEQYRTSRPSRQLSSGGAYIAANLSSSDLGSVFQLGDGMEYGGYQNFELDPGVFYNAGLRSRGEGEEGAVFAAVNGPFSATPPSSESDSESFPLIIVVSVAGAAGAVLVGIVVILLVICCCCCCCSNSSEEDKTGSSVMERGGSFRLSKHRRTTHDPLTDFRNTHKGPVLQSRPPVPVEGFVNRLLVMRQNDNQLFLEEFACIEMSPQLPCDVANLLHNRPRNRYNNILAYDQTRVKISSIRGQQGSDYINANYCAGYMKPKAYIATQGPLPETIADFWRMVWEENVRTIVMLTNVQERGKTKCEMYWPSDVASSAVYGNIEVTQSDSMQLADYTIRSFLLHKGSGKEGREVRQFHFTSWPDHGVPQFATAMLSMMRKVRAYHPVEAGPMVVHCSAGVGRSGTFIVIDSMLEKMKGGGDTIDIYGDVSMLRTQRNYMVQTEDQYFFIHEAVAEAIMCGNTEVSLEELSTYVNELCQVIPEDEQDTTYIELQFKRLAVEKKEPHRFASANKDCNKNKNRYVNVLPYETNRVCLEYMRGVDGSDYINASHIDNYHHRLAFIATQGTMRTTVDDFWRMVWQYNTPVVVMLTQLVEKGTERCVQYWPQETNQPEKYGSFTVEMTAERNSGHYTYRDLHIIDPESGQKRLIRHFQFHSWPEVGMPSNALVLVEFIREVQKLYATLNTKLPIIMQCSNGIGRSGVFIALHIILERMVTEGLVDVFQTVKNLRIQRPAMVQTLEQYQFCHDAAVDYLQSSDLLAVHAQKLDRTPSSASDVHRRKSRNSRNSSPARSESFTTKRSSRNLDLNQMGNGASHIYGESDATSTFGTQRSSVSPRGSTLSGAQLLPPGQGGTDEIKLQTVSHVESRTGEA